MKLFPVLGLTFSADEHAVKAAGYSSLVAVPWDMLASHERQALHNHYQTLKQLAERGGLSAGEMLAVLQDREWRKMPLVAAYAELDSLVRAWHAARTT